MKLNPLPIGKIEINKPIIQGGMGIGLSTPELAGAVSKEGGLGVLSSAGLDRIVSARVGKKLSAREAAKQEVIDTKNLSDGKPIGINIMVAVVDQYEDSVLGAMDGGVDVIISGAGLPLKLPEIVKAHPRANDTAIVPIVSTGRVAELICKRWQRSGRLPDAFVVEGPKAGGHIAWRTEEEANAPENSLENLVEQVLAVARKYGDIPVIAAGGIYDHQDIAKFVQMGCKGVQMGTRFLATHESGAMKEYKELLVQSTKDDIELTSGVGSPCGLLYRVLKNSPFYQQAIKGERSPRCDVGYLLNQGKCAAKKSTSSFCICNGLLAAVGAQSKDNLGLYSTGSEGWRINKVVSVKELMDELCPHQL
jgi:nitronate monooxygenase